MPFLFHLNRAKIMASSAGHNTGHRGIGGSIAIDGDKPVAHTYPGKILRSHLWIICYLSGEYPGVF